MVQNAGQRCNERCKPASLFLVSTATLRSILSPGSQRYQKGPATATVPLLKGLKKLATAWPKSRPRAFAPTRHPAQTSVRCRFAASSSACADLYAFFYTFTPPARYIVLSFFSLRLLSIVNCRFAANLGQTSATRLSDPSLSKEVTPC